MTNGLYLPTVRGSKLGCSRKLLFEYDLVNWKEQNTDGRREVMVIDWERENGEGRFQGTPARLPLPQRALAHDKGHSKMEYHRWSILGCHSDAGPLRNSPTSRPARLHKYQGDFKL